MTTLTQTRQKNASLSLILFLLVTFGAAAIGGFANASSLETWYSTLNKPFFNPPGWLFAPVWTVLYLCMAVAGWRVYLRLRKGLDTPEMWLFWIQLSLNALWSVLFFGLRMPGLAFLEVLVLWSAIALTTFAFFKRDRVAGKLFIPYLAWVTFAAILNFALWQMN